MFFKKPTSFHFNPLNIYGFLTFFLLFVFFTVVHAEIILLFGILDIGLYLFF